ncbi:CRIB domain-containing protein RIC10 [Striga asiatica]|uniref:CRIB domain-containing protein RIC10 n=1 Tax=Striga asiatica TaxID=4170 RepID=A0A5A7RGL4_STRAF|nr:CRIB domain-containing protein RIC10 [Striga asiatica]
MLIALCIIFQQLLKANGVCSQDVWRRSFSIETPFSLFHFNFYLKRQRSNTWEILRCFLLHFALYPSERWFLWLMGTKMKGIYKGFKYTLSQIFVVKEREMEIGNPTDVKHVAHIGWEGPSGGAPTWMNEFRVGADFAASSIGKSGSALSPWSSHDFGESTGQQSESFKDMPMPSPELPTLKKKEKRKKSKSTSSPKSSASCSSRTSRRGKSKSKFIESGSNPANIQVA